MLKLDMPEIIKIENQVSLDPWNEEDFQRFLQRRSVIGMVGDLPNKSVGAYMVYTLSSKNIEIINFAVNPLWQRQGFGTMMIGKLKDLSPAIKTSISMYVGDKNFPMHMFCKRNGFKAVRVERKYYFDCEDAYYFTYGCPKPEVATNFQAVA